MKFSNNEKVVDFLLYRGTPINEMPFRKYWQNVFVTTGECTRFFPLTTCIFYYYLLAQRIPFLITGFSLHRSSLYQGFSVYRDQCHKDVNKNTTQSSNYNY